MRRLRHTQLVNVNMASTSVGPSGLHSSQKVSNKAAYSVASSPGRMAIEENTPCFMALGRLPLGLFLYSSVIGLLQNSFGPLSNNSPSISENCQVRMNWLIEKGSGET